MKSRGESVFTWPEVEAFVEVKLHGRGDLEPGRWGRGVLAAGSAPVVLWWLQQMEPVAKREDLVHKGRDRRV